MIFILSLLASYSLTFLLKEKDGPFGIISLFRNFLMRNPYLGVFFYKLFSCYFCLGFYCSLIIYLLSPYLWNFNILCWGLSGAAFASIVNSLLYKE